MPYKASGTSDTSLSTKRVTGFFKYSLCLEIWEISLCLVSTLASLLETSRSNKKLYSHNQHHLAAVHVTCKWIKSFAGVTDTAQWKWRCVIRWCITAFFRNKLTIKPYGEFFSKQHHIQINLPVMLNLVPIIFLHNQNGNNSELLQSIVYLLGMLCSYCKPRFINWYLSQLSIFGMQFPTVLFLCLSSIPWCFCARTHRPNNGLGQVPWISILSNKYNQEIIICISDARKTSSYKNCMKHNLSYVPQSEWIDMETL